MINIWLALYVIFSLVAGIGGVTYFMRTDRTVAALLYFIGVLTILILFGIRWFEGTSGVFNPTTVQWPPYINTCPDYLTYYQRTKSDGTKQDTCIDRVGVSRNGQLQPFPADGNVNPNNDAYFFPLATNSSDASAKLQELCQRTIQYGLTWEGVTDGESCFTPGGNPNGTVPSGGSSANGSTCLISTPTIISNL
jgi:hypothetical protein